MDEDKMVRRKSTRGQSRGVIFALYAVAVLASVLILYPVARMILEVVMGGSGTGSSGVARAFALPGIWQTLTNTVIVVAVSVVLAVTIGSAFAWLNERTDARLGWLASILPIVPLLAPPITIAIGWVFMLSPRAGFLNVMLRWLTRDGSGVGPFNIFSWYGLIALYLMELIPVVYLVVSSALRNIDPMLEQASRVYGSGPFKTLWKVTLPSVKGALASAAWLATTVALALYSAPSIVGSSANIDILTARIVRLLTSEYPPKTEEAIALGSVILIVIAIGWVLQRRVIAGGRISVIGGKASSDSLVRLGGWRVLARVCLLTFLLVSVAVPVLGLLLVSLQQFWSADIHWSSLGLGAYAEALNGNGPTGLALWDSIRLAAVVATLIMLVAFCVTSLSYWLKPGRLSAMIEGILKLPAGFSHVIVAIGVLLVFFAKPFDLSGTLLIIGIAYLIIYMPQGSIAANSAISQVDLQLLEASQMSGARPVRTGWRILLPLSLGGLANGWVLVFVYIVGDLTASVLLSGTATPTVGYVLLQEFNNGSYPVIAALAVVISLASSVVVLSVLALASRRKHA